MAKNHEGKAAPEFQPTTEYFDEQQRQCEIVDDHLPIADEQIRSAATWAEECLFSLNVMMGKTGDFVRHVDGHIFGVPSKKGIYGPPKAPPESARAKYYAAMKRLADALALIASFADEGELEADGWGGSWGSERRSLKGMFKDAQEALAEFRKEQRVPPYVPKVELES